MQILFSVQQEIKEVVKRDLKIVSCLQCINLLNWKSLKRSKTIWFECSINVYVLLISVLMVNMSPKKVMMWHINCVPYLSMPVRSRLCMWRSPTWLRVYHMRHGTPCPPVQTSHPELEHSQTHQATLLGFI